MALKILLFTTTEVRSCHGDELLHEKIPTSVVVNGLNIHSKKSHFCVCIVVARNQQQLTIVSCPKPQGPLSPVGFWSLMCWRLRFPWLLLSLWRALVSSLSRFACPSHVSCMAPGSV